MLIAALFFSTHASAMKEDLSSQLADLKNYQVNTAKMISAGLPRPKHFEILKAMGVTKGHYVL